MTRTPPSRLRLVGASRVASVVPLGVSGDLRAALVRETRGLCRCGRPADVVVNDRGVVSLACARCELRRQDDEAARRSRIALARATVARVAVRKTKKRKPSAEVEWLNKHVRVDVQCEVHVSLARPRRRSGRGRKTR
jgi:hypothetical protein